MGILETIVGKGELLASNFPFFNNVFHFIQEKILSFVRPDFPFIQMLVEMEHIILSL